MNTLNHITSQCSRQQIAATDLYVRRFMDKLESEINSIFEKAATGGYETLLGGSIKWNEIHGDVEKVIARHLTSKCSRQDKAETKSELTWSGYGGGWE